MTSLPFLAMALELLLAAPAADREGQVVSASRHRLYLNKGSRDGLEVGAVLHLRRGQRSQGTCTVEWVSDRHGTCTGDGIKVGDTFSVTPPTPAPALASLRSSAPLSASELEVRRAALVEASIPKVEFKGPQSGLAVPLRADAALTHSSWASVTATGGPFAVERLDMAVRGYPIGGGFKFLTDLTLMQWTQRSMLDRTFGANGFRGDELSTWLYVRQLEIASHDSSRWWHLSAGRVRPSAMPGVAGLDGAQAGWHNASGTAEAGAYGGLLPDPITLGIGSAVTAGAYYSVEHRGQHDDTLRWIRQDARVAVLTSSAIGQRIEAQAGLEGAIGPTDLAADVRAGLVTPQGFVLSNARLDFDWRLGESLRLQASGRWIGERDPELIAVASSAYSGRMLRADAALLYDVSRQLSVGFNVGAMEDLDTVLGRVLAGPQLTLPHLWSNKLSLGLGYEEEFGWMGGRAAYLQAVVLPVGKFRLLTRVSYYADIPTRVGVTDWTASGQELGLYFNVSAPLAKWLSVRASFLGRLDLGQLASGASQAGMTFNLGLAGEL